VYQTHINKLVVADDGKLISFLKNTTVPDEFLRFREPELRRDEIKKALKEGVRIPGAELEETESVVIK
jgi:hypothetical protein